MEPQGAITDIVGISVGHWSDPVAATGCTVILVEPAAVGGVDVRGSAPGTRETDLLRPGNLVDRVDAIVLAGGSAFGLAAADGVMRYLEERGRGYVTGAGPVPIVPAAVLYDLNIGDSRVRPDAAAGYAACVAASVGVPEGSVGAGTGATVAKLWGLAGRRKGGIGTCSGVTADGTRVGVIVAVNALGAIVDRDGSWITTPPAGPDQPSPGNTTIGVVATDGALDVAGARKVADMAHDGLALAIRPVHTLYDGDTIFALATGQNGQVANVSAIGTLAAVLMARAIVRAVRLATPLAGVPAVGS